MLFGSLVGDSIGTEKSLVPTLVPPGIKEYELRAKIGDIYLVGYADHYCPFKKILHENKTSENTTKWTQKAVNEHGQLTMYALLLFLQDKTPPSDVTMYLNYIPVIKGGDFMIRLPEPPTYTQFKTTRTNLQIVEYVGYIKNIVKKMNEYIEKYDK